MHLETPPATRAEMPGLTDIVVRLGVAAEVIPAKVRNHFPDGWAVRKVGCQAVRTAYIHLSPPPGLWENLMHKWNI